MMTSQSPLWKRHGFPSTSERIFLETAHVLASARRSYLRSVLTFRIAFTMIVMALLGGVAIMVLGSTGAALADASPGAAVAHDPNFARIPAAKQSSSSQLP